MNRPFTVIAMMLFAGIVLNAQPRANIGFIEFVSNRTENLSDKGSANSTAPTFEKVCPIATSLVARRVLSEYGAVFIVSERIVPPPRCMFAGEVDVAQFHSRLTINGVSVNGVEISLQKPAAESLAQTIVEAKSAGMRISLLDGAIAGGRSYADTVVLWRSRFEPALRFWVAREKITAGEALGISQLPIEKQIEKVMEWESGGLWFGTNRMGSIFASTAPPGTSQHLSLVAIDVEPPITRDMVILFNAHGWFQTVKGDPSHFTYLGLKESQLPSRGLRAVIVEGTMYWVPNISFETNPSN